MRIEMLALRNFRNYKKLEVELDDNLNFLVGANAQGKTNLLEAVVFAASGRSFRAKTEAELVLWGKDSCDVTVRVSNKLGMEKLRVTYQQETKKKLFFHNGLSLIRANYLGRLYPVLFTPEDLAIVKGSPQQRRKFFDEQISKVSPVYEYELARFYQVVKQRNQLLRMQRERILGTPEIASWNEQLAAQGAKVISRRLFALRRLGILARLAHRRLTGGDETLSINYHSSLQFNELSQEKAIEQILSAAMEEKSKQEARMGQTLVGPHRDDILFAINGKDARLYASQGQQRTLVLALKLAELEFIKGESGEFPILLFDDVFSELDAKRRKLLVETIEGRVQTLITATAAERFDFFKRSGKMFTVHGGEVVLGDPRS